MTLKELAPGTKVFHFFFGNNDLYEFSGSWGEGGRQLCKLPLGPISLNFLQFSAKILSNNRFSSLTQWLVSSLRVWKSWIRHWFVWSITDEYLWRGSESQTLQN